MSDRSTARAADAIAAQLPDAIELVVLGIRAGATPVRSVEIAAQHAPARIAPVLAEVVRQVHRGARLADALDELRRMAGTAADDVVDGLASADRYGLPLAPVLDRLALDVRAERQRRAERSARVLPVRLAFPLVACSLPSFVLLAIVPVVLGALSTLQASAP